MPSANPPKHRSAPPRRRIDTWRRAGSLVLAVLCFLAVPQVAQALFTARQAPAGTSVSVAELVMPTAIRGSYACTGGLFNESVEVTVTGLSDGGQLARAVYAFRLVKSDGSATSWTQVGAGVKTASLELGGRTDGRASSYRVEAQARFGSWVSPIGSSGFGCPALLSGKGTF